MNEIPISPPWVFKVAGITPISVAVLIICHDFRLSLSDPPKIGRHGWIRNPHTQALADPDAYGDRFQVSFDGCTLARR
jgi:hypothetical protein